MSLIRETALVSINHVINQTCDLDVAPRPCRAPAGLWKWCLLVQCGSHEGGFIIITVTEVWAAAGPPDFSTRTPTTEGWGWNVHVHEKMENALLVRYLQIQKLIFGWWFWNTTWRQSSCSFRGGHGGQEQLVAMLLRTHEELERNVCNDLRHIIVWILYGWFDDFGQAIMKVQQASHANMISNRCLSGREAMGPFGLTRPGIGPNINNAVIETGTQATTSQSNQHWGAAQHFFWLTGLSSSLRSMVFFLKNGFGTN